jgi:hypothetical protein
VIGDSIATAIQYEPGARSILSRGLDLQLQLAVCRRIDGDSCPYAGVRPPTLVQLAATLGPALGPTAVLVIGYNDYEQSFPQTVEAALGALAKAGVERVLWVTLRADRQDYVVMNDQLREAATKHPELTLADWNLYSRSHPTWFQSDGLHLTGEGAAGMATLIRQTLATFDIPPQPVAIRALPLRAAKVGHVFTTRLSARGGIAPYRFVRVAGLLPKGLRLLVDGRITGVPLAAGTAKLTVRAIDADGRSAARQLRLIVRLR